MGLFDSLEKRGIFNEEMTTPEEGGVSIPLRLLELSRKNDAVRYWVAEIEAGDISVIDGLIGCIEILSEQNRMLRYRGMK